jgi:hypothetical protein
MTPDVAPSPHSLATASGLLLGALGAAMAIGVLLGWAAGDWQIGLLIGALAGIPLGVVTVYLVYSRADRATPELSTPRPSRPQDDEDDW